MDGHQIPPAASFASALRTAAGLAAAVHAAFKARQGNTQHISAVAAMPRCGLHLPEA